jgi:hypothetical protein
MSTGWGYTGVPLAVKDGEMKIFNVNKITRTHFIGLLDHIRLEQLFSVVDVAPCGVRADNRLTFIIG